MKFTNDSLGTFRLSNGRPVRYFYILPNFSCSVKNQNRDFEISSGNFIFPLYRIAIFGYNAHNYVNFTK